MVWSVSLIGFFHPDFDRMNTVRGHTRDFSFTFCRDSLALVYSLHVLPFLLLYTYNTMLALRQTGRLLLVTRAGLKI